MKGQTTLYTRKKGLENALKEAKVKKWWTGVLLEE
jgi:hypothetical protein